MKRVLAAVTALAMFVGGALVGAPSAAALDAGTFTLAGWTSGNLTVNNLTITRDASGAYRGQVSYTIAGQSMSTSTFTNQGCTPAGGECHIVDAAQFYVLDNFAYYYFKASLAGMESGSPQFTMLEARVRSEHWDVFPNTATTGLVATLVPSPPALTSITPATAKESGGGTAEILGSHLLGASAVSFGSRATRIAAVTDDKVVVEIPVAGANPVGSAVDVTVTTPTGAVVLKAAFTYTSNPPSVASVTPSCGVTAGEKIVIDGFRLVGTTAVTIGGQTVPFTVVDQHLEATAPALTGSQKVIVTTPAGSDAGLAEISYLPCSPLPKPTLTVSSTTPAGGFATIGWSFVAGDPAIANVQGLQYALSLAGPFQNVGGTQSGTSGSFTVSGITKTRSVVWVKVVNKNPQGRDIYPGVAVIFASPPTALPPNTGNAGTVPAPVSTSGASTSASGPTQSSGGDPAAVGAPCLAPKGSLYPAAFGTVGSQLVVVPGRPGEQTPTTVTVVDGVLPPGLSLDAATGIIYGVPTAAGKYSVSLTGTYLDGSKASATVPFTIDNDAQTLTYPLVMIGGVGQSVETGPTTNAPVGSTYSIVCGKVPAGTVFDERTGRITGTPTTEDDQNPPLRIVERNKAGAAAASFIFLVGPAAGPQVSYPAHPHLRTHHRTRIRPHIVDAASILYFKVIRGKLNKGLRINHKTGVVTGVPKRSGGRPHVVTVAGVHADGNLVAANPMTITVRRGR